jgi:TonB family protein
VLFRSPLKLVRYVEPDVPARLRGRVRANSEVTVTFRINPDGSVSDVDVRNTSNKALDPVVLDAVKQWRYEPVAEARIHAVQLVFNLEN